MHFLSSGGVGEGFSEAVLVSVFMIVSKKGLMILCHHNNLLAPDLLEPVLDHGDVLLDAGDVLRHEAHQRQQPLYLRVLALRVKLGELVPGHHLEAAVNVHHRVAVQGLRGGQGRVTCNHWTEVRGRGSRGPMGSNQFLLPLIFMAIPTILKQ